MARALDLPEVTGTRPINRLRSADDSRLEEWMRVKSLESPVWLKEVYDSLNEIATLSPNWDSYGSNPVSNDAIRAAKTLLSNVNVDQLPKPHVSPVPGGGVGLHWRLRNRDLEIEFRPDGGAEYLGTDLANAERNDEGEIPTFKVAQRVLRWLIGR